ncbi:MAG TPA: MaoC/PaaZ C-terminal domain-containing protein [Acidimicrobiia bacterium]|nr:MaoC/PaaZ C-terminal domain-containing protein [Acidimicrobiia bacterium]
MPIDPQLLLGAQLPSDEFAWDEDRIILYHLGIGAGAQPVDPEELRYVYEGSLKVLPTFATIPPFAVTINVGALPGMDVNPAMILHGEQMISIHRPLPVRGRVTSEGRVVGVHDKGTGALVEVEVVSSNGDGPLFTNRSGIFVRGEGGFGGEAPSSGQSWPQIPPRDPDAVSYSATLPQQALLYRLSGDKNPLHADPAFAAFAGFDRPILHGLATFGVVCKAVVDSLLGGDVGAVAGFGGRFSGVVFPGEIIATSMWRENDGIVINAAVVDRDAPVLSPALLVLA